MSFTQLKEKIAQATPEERLELAALLTHLNRVEDPIWRAELDRRLQAMEMGKKTGRKDLEEIHERLSNEGR